MSMSMNTISSLNHKIKADVPRSPLLSVAHSVRTQLTKLGNRLGGNIDNRQTAIRSSASLSR